jgi:hypothetical protein
MMSLLIINTTSKLGRALIWSPSTNGFMADLAIGGLCDLEQSLDGRSRQKSAQRHDVEKKLEQCYLLQDPDTRKH